jgi:hypothetical protein
MRTIRRGSMQLIPSPVVPDAEPRRGEAIGDLVERVES